MLRSVATPLLPEVMTMVRPKKEILDEMVEQIVELVVRAMKTFGPVNPF